MTALDPVHAVAPPAVAVDDPRAAQLIAAARAEVARLSLELRAARHKADAAELAPAVAPPPLPAISDRDAAAGREFLRATLARHVDTRRAAWNDELEQTRAEAARVVASARRRAEAYVATAHDDALAALARPGEGLPPLPPLPAVIVADEVASPAPPVLDEPMRTVGSPEAALSLMGMIAALQPHLAAPVADGFVPALATVHIPTAPQASAAPIAPPPRAPGPPIWKRLLYPDVLLPLVAVVAVLIVLLAWVG